MTHQRALLKAQLHLAGRLHRAVSLHDVQTHGVTIEVLKETWAGYENEVLSNKEKKKIRDIAPEISSSETEDDDFGAGVDSEKRRRKRGIRDTRPFPPRICIHSCAIPKEGLYAYLRPQNPAGIFFSFSAGLNLSSPGVRSRTEEVLRILPDESILVESDWYQAGAEMDAKLEVMARQICLIKGWGLEEGVRKLGENWKRFVFGDEVGG